METGQESGEQAAPPEGTEAGTTESETFDAEYVTKLRKEAAKYRTEAKANADAAKKLAAIEEANKTEQQKLEERLTEAQKAADQARADALRFKIASKFGVTDEDADLFLTGTDEETLTRQAERLSQHSSDRKKNGNVVPKEGSTSTAVANDERATVRELFGAG
jgi:uncharacterized protein YaiL (DUF2058 family)